MRAKSSKQRCAAQFFVTYVTLNIVLNRAFSMRVNLLALYSSPRCFVRR